MSRNFHPCKLVPQNSCLTFSGPAFLTVPYFHFHSPQKEIRRTEVAARKTKFAMRGTKAATTVGGETMARTEGI